MGFKGLLVKDPVDMHPAEIETVSGNIKVNKSINGLKVPDVLANNITQQNWLDMLADFNATRGDVKALEVAVDRWSKKLQPGIRKVELPRPRS